MPTLVTPQEQRLRRRIFMFGGVAAALVVAFGLWSTLRRFDRRRGAARRPCADRHDVGNTAQGRITDCERYGGCEEHDGCRSLRPRPLRLAIASATASRPSILALAGTPSATVAARQSRLRALRNQPRRPSMPASTAVTSRRFRIRRSRQDRRQAPRERPAGACRQFGKSCSSRPPDCASRKPRGAMR